MAVEQEHIFRPDANPVLLILPDIHGRTFWKKAVESYPSLPVVFLGDFLDPYYWNEGISAAEAIPNFAEILNYKKSNNDRVTLLLGNHDLHYFYKDMDCSRKDCNHEDEIKEMFTNNMDCFQLVCPLRQAGRTFVFSHAGIVPGWLDWRFPDTDVNDIDSICTALNTKLRTDPEFVPTLIADVSHYRWGSAEFGSPVWADIAEHEKVGLFAFSDDIIQIFGHTQQKASPVFRPHFACLDCRRPFLLTSEGLITEISYNN